MGFLYLLEKIRIPILNEVMLAITTLGEETAFLVIALVLFWCVDKYLGYYTLSVGFVGVIGNQFLKLLFRIPRPWVIDPDFTILEQARAAATGYSFPSGHTQSAVGTFGSIAYVVKRKGIRIGAVVIAALVAFSRMYIGVHTPLDVGVSVVIAVILIFAIHPLIYKKEHKLMPILFGIMLLLSVGYLCFAEFYPFPADMDLDNYVHGVESAYTLLGALMGMFAVYYLDKKYIHFETNAVWWVQICKVVAGLILVLIIKSGLKPCLNMLFGAYFGRAIRYFLVVLTAGALWPLTFKWFSKLGIKE